MRNAALAIILLTSGAAAEPVTVVALGDSLTQGYGLTPDEGFVPQLQRWLDERSVEVRLVNAGVSGDTTAGGLSRIGWSLTSDVDGLVVELGGNDMLRGIDPASVRANLDGILTEADARGLPVLLVGMNAPPNFGAAYETAFNAIYPDLANAHGTLLYPDFFAALTALGDRKEVLREFMQPDGTHPNAAGVGHIVDDLGPYVLELVGKIR